MAMPPAAVELTSASPPRATPPLAFTLESLPMLMPFVAAGMTLAVGPMAIFSSAFAIAPKPLLSSSPPMATEPRPVEEAFVPTAVAPVVMAPAPAPTAVVEPTVAVAFAPTAVARIRWPGVRSERRCVGLRGVSAGNQPLLPRHPSPDAVAGHRIGTKRCGADVKRLRAERNHRLPRHRQSQYFRRRLHRCCCRWRSIGHRRRSPNCRCRRHSLRLYRQRCRWRCH